jgi:putative transposase
VRAGFLYLVAVHDWAKRRDLAWRLSNTMTTDVNLDALEAARRDPHTDQGSHFTSTAFVEFAQQRGIRLTKDGKGVRHGNLFVERLWKSGKYQEVYLHAYESVAESPQV